MDCRPTFGFGCVFSNVQLEKVWTREVHIYTAAGAIGLHNSGYCWWRARETAQLKLPTSRNAYWRETQFVAIAILRKWRRKWIRHNRSKAVYSITQSPLATSMVESITITAEPDTF